MNIYDIGRTIRFGMTLTDINDNPADPGTLTFRIKDPSGAVTSFVWQTDAELVRSAQGEFYIDYQVGADGPHRYRWESAGSVPAVREHGFYGRAGAFD